MILRKLTLIAFIIFCSSLRAQNVVVIDSIDVYLINSKSKEIIQLGNSTGIIDVFKSKFLESDSIRVSSDTLTLTSYVYAASGLGLDIGFSVDNASLPLSVRNMVEEHKISRFALENVILTSATGIVYQVEGYRGMKLK